MPYILKQPSRSDYGPEPRFNKEIRELFSRVTLLPTVLMERHPSGELVPLLDRTPQPGKIGHILHVGDCVVTAYTDMPTFPRIDMEAPFRLIARARLRDGLWWVKLIMGVNNSITSMDEEWM